MVDERVAMITTVAGSCTGPCGAASREFYHANRLGTVIALANESGTLTAQYIYTPFGVETPVSGSANPFRYTGQRADTETGLMYYRARYYDPVAGRFLQTDPVMYADQMNLYAYVGNGPLTGTDPTGMERVTVERQVSRGTGTRLNGTASVTVETDLSQEQVDSLFSEIPDEFFIAQDGTDFGQEDQGPVGIRSRNGIVSAGGEDTKLQRETIRIAAQISRSMQSIREEFDLDSMEPRGRFLYDPSLGTAFGVKSGSTMLIGPASINSGLSQTIATATHERYHFRWGSNVDDHQRVYNAVFDLLSPMKIDHYYRCFESSSVGCR